ncbi:ribonucleoside-triphosphate reductase [Caldanaerobius fijiensis DSM 17918]|uniref:Ribonucleoside-triphosphate reductase n=1 Tax=Caldanaerobius fijiensis DSM 17918 TaxID=1121256 RepID=A0A1M5C189_9THEO|nr:ribonucleoside triphosphate reductase [Caldanaerobius fijiensis]SHF48436.1 ribonucleoside-triphosphate reductase [Caldanaerobius fijiensis DSM 17918]
MITYIRKRDGSIVPFEGDKIEQAIFKAAKAVGGDDRSIAHNLAVQVISILEQKYNNAIPSVEDVQDIVEKVLIENGHAKTAKAYILYRKQHQDIREFKKLFLDIEETVDQYIGKVDWRINENSNMGFSLQGLNNHISTTVISKYWLNKIYPKEVRDAHVNGDFHIHDLGLLSVYCCGWDLKDLLLSGFTGVEGKVASKPPKHFRTALGQIVNFFYTLQGEAAGAQAFSNFDTYLAPFIYYDGLTYKEVKQAMQEFIFNLNVPTRVGFQTPFVNITMDLVVPGIMADEPVIIGGQLMDRTYKEFQKEMDMLNTAFAEVMMEGDASGRIFTFPIPTYNITKEFDWDSPVVDKVMEMTAKYGLPYFSNFINSDMKPEDARSMCLHPDEMMIVKIDGRVVRTTIGDLAQTYVEKYDDEGWAEATSNLQALTLNPDTYKVEWKNIKRFFRMYDNCMVTIETYDGKKIRVSRDHPVAVYTEEGITYKKASDVNEKDILLVLRKADDALNHEDIYIDEYKVDEDMAFLMGFFIADGNYLYDPREEFSSYQKERGIQFTFNDDDIDLIERVKDIVYRKFHYVMKFKKDPRYDHSLYGYFYNTEIARMFSNSGLRKYGGVPDIIFNARKEIIKSFLEGIFAGDGYDRGKELHINDQKLAEDLVLLYSLIGEPTTIRYRESSQTIRLQHPFYNKDAMVCKSSIDRTNAHTEESMKILSSDIALVKVKSIKLENLAYEQDFYDIELEENHYFVHSLGNITHNCCRLRLDNRELRKRGGGLFGANPLTGSIGVVTINMPRIGYLSKTKEEFLSRVERLMDIARTSLEIKREVLERLTQEGLYPYARFYLRDIYKRFGSYWKNHFNTIGLIGMNEALLNFMGVGIASEEGRSFALEVLDFMREKLRQYQEETGVLYNLEASPAEGASYRLAKKDKEMYPGIITCGQDEPYYTNSTQLPVDFTDDIFTALDLQEELQCKYTGGTVLHGFIGERISDVSTCKALVKKIAYNYKIPYYTITPTFSVCNEHGYIAGEHFTCPYCGKDCEVYSRVVGYYRPVQCWNNGKKEEFKDRKEFAV